MVSKGLTRSSPSALVGQITITSGSLGNVAWFGCEGSSSRVCIRSAIISVFPEPHAMRAMSSTPSKNFGTASTE